MVTTTSPERPDDARPPGDPRSGRPTVARRIGRIAAIVLVVGMVLGWGYLFFVAPTKPPPGTLDDATIGPNAERVCARALEKLDALPPAHETREHVQRAKVIEQANAILAQELDDLAHLVPPTGEDHRRLTEWLADWHTYLQDRRDYASSLMQDPKARLYETAKAGTQISQGLDFFARINAMPSCGTPGDVA